MKILLSLALVLLTLFVLINSSAYASPKCSRTVETSDGVRIVQVDCEFTIERPTRTFLNPSYLSDRVSELMDQTNQKIQAFKDRIAALTASRTDTHEKASDIWEKQQDMIDAVRDKAEAQKERMQRR